MTPERIKELQEEMTREGKDDDCIPLETTRSEILDLLAIAEAAMEAETALERAERDILAMVEVSNLHENDFDIRQIRAALARLRKAMGA